jgi:hypothetical protein
VNTRERLSGGDRYSGWPPAEELVTKTIKEGIIRALADKEAAGKATPTLIAEYHKFPKEKQNYVG